MNLSTNPKPKPFKNPPIIEAIIAVTIKALPESALNALIELSPRLAELGYTLKAPMTSHEFQVAIENGISRASNRDEVTGYQFISADGGFAFQVLRTGLIFSQLGHYQSWEFFTAEAKKIWNIYVSVIAEVSILRYGVRYLNKIFTPLGEPSEDYFRIHIAVATDLPQMIFEPYLRLAFMLSNPSGKLLHQQGLLPPEREGFVTTLLDNDFSFPANELAPDDLWTAIDSIRETKDHFFFNMLTDKMKESFDA